MEAEAEEAKAPPRMNRRQWRAARGNREDKWTRKRRLLLEANEEKRRAQVAAEAAADAAEREDEEAAVAMRYRDNWISTFSRLCGSYEEATSIKPMRDSLDWPLDVYGIVAARDSIDRNRNLLFNRTRDNCQRLTSWDASLLLTGPSRAVVIVDPVNYEVELKVKGDTPSEDKLLSLLVIEDKYYLPGDRRQGVHCHTYSSKLSTVEVTVGHLAKTVEATIAVQVVEGSWPTGQLAITVDLLHVWPVSMIWRWCYLILRMAWCLLLTMGQLSFHDVLFLSKRMES
ncbi:uncharacterized protein [Triticum aestivum]|uniref:uncharacterized protein isoform X2 n=1 Tax=Triticum aestivum TaxID=4565 RepID=UPI001D02502B|nr:uncharacterized protein LOC123190548 isoform X2 [Triticum aestivum]